MDLVTILECFVAIITVGGFFITVYKLIKKIDRTITTVDELKQEQFYVVKSIFVIMDGLGQLGANGPVTKAKEELRDYIIKGA
jgi:hypothetical protein